MLVYFKPHTYLLQKYILVYIICTTVLYIISYIYTYSSYICLYTQLLVAFFNYKKPLSYALLPWYIPIHNNNPLVKEEKWCQIILTYLGIHLLQRSLNINTICVYSYFFKEYINKSHPLLVYSRFHSRYYVCEFFCFDVNLFSYKCRIFPVYTY